MSALPDFEANGDMPLGVHCGRLSEVIARFGKGSLQRCTVSERLERIYRLAAGTGNLARFIVFGSFVTAKAWPNDVDIFLVMADRFEIAKVAAEARHVFDHMAAHNLLGASVFWVTRSACLGGEDAAVLDWQIKRDGTRRGIVEITSHD